MNFSKQADLESERQGLGTLYGVGVGPGDPGLVTLKAIEIIRQVPTVAFPVNKEGASSRAFEAVRRHLPPHTRQLPLVMPMTRDQQRLDQAHEAAAVALRQAGTEGREVAYLSLGDPLFYSTFGYLAQAYPGPVQVISGVSSTSAMAAALGAPLAAGDLPTVVASGKDHETIVKALEMGASLVIIKAKALSRQSLELLEQTGALKRAQAAVELGGPGERLLQSLDLETAASLPYFSIIWINPNRQLEV